MCVCACVCVCANVCVEGEGSGAAREKEGERERERGGGGEYFVSYSSSCRSIFANLSPTQDLFNMVSDMFCAQGPVARKPTKG